MVHIHYHHSSKNTGEIQPAVGVDLAAFVFWASLNILRIVSVKK